MLLIFRSSCDVVELSKGLRVLVTSEGENRLAMLWPQVADANMNITSLDYLPYSRSARIRCVSLKMNSVRIAV